MNYSYCAEGRLKYKQPFRKQQEVTGVIHNASRNSKNRSEHTMKEQQPPRSNTIFP